ncbi:hypothetical protein E2C01_065130 [Portunus trituberculatus]|uniref:Uncharacterized protein n=1 Tax=Portunus trituberculatus TaxID=210409 RepID=A0A5B7HQ89_PORTR|nr:hypothetical protein [Portunus trituberculatus]
MVSVPMPHHQLPLLFAGKKYRVFTKMGS